QEEENVSKYSGGINTFATIGGYRENPYPADISSDYIDGFSVVVAHETNHRVDPDYIYINEDLNSRRKQLVEQAGYVDKQYLRSNVGAEYFQNAPQEFIASISNQWFCSSEHTLELGLQRYEEGYSEPLNQVLYFCELYSAGTDTTQFYDVNTEGEIIMTKVPVQRDENGHINQLNYKGTTYNFELDSDGNVTNYEEVTGINKNDSKDFQFELVENYPNPFNNQTKIRYSIDKKARVELAVYNLSGNKVKSLITKQQRPGKYTTFWKGVNSQGQKVASGTYIFQLRKNDQVDIEKGLLIK
ncbi:MAG TPA: FlgD immunoglobulin-like domain containing protein, partial [bacterium]|nr:FlgD immunoglobulin-like domain containing protein [bacterium]